MAVGGVRAGVVGNIPKKAHRKAAATAPAVFTMESGGTAVSTIGLYREPCDTSELRARRPLGAEVRENR